MMGEPSTITLKNQPSMTIVFVFSFVDFLFWSGKVGWEGSNDGSRDGRKEGSNGLLNKASLLKP